MERTKRGPYGPNKSKILVGKKFGYLEVIKMEKPLTSNRPEYQAICKCHNCGKECIVAPYALRSGKQKACGCLQGNRKKGKYHCCFKGHEDISGSVWYKIKKGAKKRNLDFSINIKEIWELFEKQKRKCALTGLPIKMGVKEKMGTASLDRINSNKGYIKGNVQWVHRNVNIIKHSCSQEYFVNICRKVVQNKELKDIIFLSDKELLSNPLFARGI